MALSRSGSSRPLLLALLTTALGHTSALGTTGIIALGRGTSWPTFKVSGDGTTVVGGFFDGDRWTAATGVQEIGTPLDSLGSPAVQVNFDGSVVVGGTVISSQLGRDGAYRWTPTGGFQDLVAPSQNFVAATGVSGDGQVIFGQWSQNGSSATRGFRWTQQTGSVDIGFFERVYGVTGDGTTAFGGAAFGENVTPAYWTVSGGFRTLGNPTGGVEGYALGASYDASVAVGTVRLVGVYFRPFRWTMLGGSRLLPMLSGMNVGQATDVSGDGSIIVGFQAISSSSVQVATIWTEALGAMTLSSYLADQGVSTTGWSLNEATSANRDGTVIVGVGMYQGQSQVFMATLPRCGSGDFNCDGDVGTDADIEAFFACIAGSCPPPPCTATADFNGDGDVGTDADIEAFFRVLAGGSC